MTGFFGSGKTALITALARKLHSEYSKKVAAVLNELGEVPFDSIIAEKYGLRVREIWGGCICCESALNLIDVLLKLYEGFKPDIVLVEPSSLAAPAQINWAIEHAARKMSGTSMASVIVLVDAVRHDELFSDKDLLRLVSKQLGDADIIAINKVDAVEDDAIRACERAVAELNKDAQVIRVSAIRGDGLDEICETIVG